MPAPPKSARDWSSDHTYEAAGLFIALLGSIERGKFREAIRARDRLATLGYLITFQPGRRPALDRKAVGV